jgi:hypothetical protein
MLMTILMLLAFAYQLIGNMAHEVIGIVIFALFITHNLLNKRWYKTLQKGKQGNRKGLSIAVNLLLLLDMMILAASSLMISRDLFGFLHINGGFVARQLHVLTSYWGLILLSIHLGVHWSLVLGVIQRHSRFTSANPFCSWVFRFLGFLISAYGLIAFFDMKIGPKLILYYSFDYWDFENAAILFFINLLAIIGLYICITYYILKLSGKENKTKRVLRVTTSKKRQGILRG